MSDIREGGMCCTHNEDKDYQYTVEGLVGNGVIIGNWLVVGKLVWAISSAATHGRQTYSTRYILSYILT